MAESGIREIQVSRKQLVFLFMASVVFVVVIFLLGVSVGRGSRSPISPALPADLAVTTTEGPMPAPPNTPADPAALTYNGLKGTDGTVKPATTSTPGTPAGAATADPKSPPPAGPPAAKTPDPVPTSAPPKPVAAPAPTSAPKSAPPPATSATKAATSTTAATPAGWFVQVESFRSKDLADALVSKLKAKGYDVYIVDTPKPLLRVRIGPYPQKSGADGAVAQLKKDGFSSPIVGR
jgi:DedD protein